MSVFVGSSELVGSIAALTLAVPAALGVPAAAARPGELDPSFGRQGKVLTRLCEGAVDARGLALAPRGRIVVGGGCFDRGGYEGLALARYTRSGRLDATFGAGGRVTPYGLSAAARAVARQLDGRILAVGSGYEGRIVLSRYRVDGTLDPSFGIGGTVVGEVGGSGSPAAVLVQPRGRIVVAGTRSVGEGSGVFLAAYTSAGAPDLSVGTGGVTVVPAEAGLSEGNALVADSKGRLLVAGTWRPPAGSRSRSSLGVARFSVDGAPDGGFGVGGTVRTPLGWGAAGLGLACTPGDGVVVAGSTVAGRVHDPDGSQTVVNRVALVRYEPNGRLVRSFGRAGRLLLRVGTTAQGTSVIVTHGRIVVAGSSEFHRPAARPLHMAQSLPGRTAHAGRSPRPALCHGRDRGDADGQRRRRIGSGVSGAARWANHRRGFGQPERPDRRARPSTLPLALIHLERLALVASARCP